MKKFIPREKLSKRERKALDAMQRTMWTVPPVTKRKESGKLYDRKKARRMQRDELGGAPFLFLGMGRRAERLSSRNARASA